MTGRDALKPQVAVRDDEDLVQVYDVALSLAYAPEMRQALVVISAEQPHTLVEVLSPTMLRLTITDPSWAARPSDMPFRLHSLHMQAMMRAEKVRHGYSDIHGVRLT